MRYALIVLVLMASLSLPAFAQGGPLSTGAGRSVLSQMSARPTMPGQVVVTGDRGEFQHSFTETNGFVVWRDPMPNGSRVGPVSGIITPTTRITVLNRSIRRNELDLLNGRQVVVIAKLRYVGHGEGQRVYCDELTILVLP